MIETPVIRQASQVDAMDLADLLSLLGHVTSAEQIFEMWPAWSLEGNSALIATRRKSQVVGLATLHRMRVLHRPRPVGRITALVVVETCRGQGIGRSLVEAAEAIFRTEGCGLIEVTSNLRLIEAHQFYEHLGFARTSTRFAKNLSGK